MPPRDAGRSASASSLYRYQRGCVSDLAISAGTSRRDSLHSNPYPCAAAYLCHDCLACCASADPWSSSSLRSDDRKWWPTTTIRSLARGVASTLETARVSATASDSTTTNSAAIVPFIVRSHNTRFFFCSLLQTLR